MSKNNKQRGVSGIVAIGIVAAVVAVVIMFGYSVNPKQSATNEAALPVTDKMEQGSVKAEGTPADKAKDERIVAEQTETIVAQKDGRMVARAFGVYQVYDPEKLVMADNGGKVVLFFNASWCPTCRAADTELKGAQIPDKMVILSVDYDKYTELKKKYGVTYQHTFVQVDSKGDLISKWSGGGLTEIISHAK